LLAQVDSTEARLVSIFGHELRSHIAPIKHAADLLKRSTLDAAIARRAADVIERQVDGMARLVDELLAVVQMKTPQLMLRRVDTVVEAIVRRGADMVEQLASARRQTLSIRMPAEPIYIEADELWLTQAVQNVIGNAIKYTDPGGRIEIEARRDGSEVEISVWDTGIGLAPGELATVFDLFARVAQPATRPTVGGLGVGLHLAECVVAAHAGSIHATSAGLGRGSTFVIRLPCRASNRPAD
jgi:signal transduction histidine kinase